MPPCAKKKQHRCARSRPAEVQVGAVADEDAPDWVNAVFGHPDVGPLVLAHVDDLKDVAHFRRACKLLHTKDTIFAEAARIFKSYEPSAKDGFCSVTRHACVSGNLRLIKFLHEHVTAATTVCARTAASRGHIHVLAYLHSIGVAMNEEVSMSASYNPAKGLETLKWLQAHNVPWNETVLVGPLLGGSVLGDDEHIVAILQYVFDREFEMTGVEFLERGRVDQSRWDLHERVKDAASLGSIACIKILEAHGGHSTLAACRLAIEHGHLDTFKYLATTVMDTLAARSGCSLLIVAIQKAQLDCFQYLYPLCAPHMDYHLDQLVMQSAFMYGKTGILRYLNAQGVQFSQENIKYLLNRDGNEEAILMMAREYDYHFTVADMKQCVLLQYKKNYKAMHTKLRIPWPDDTLQFCVANKDTEGFMYALEHGAMVEDFLLARCCCSGLGCEIEALVKYHNAKITLDCMYALAKGGYSCIGIFLVAWKADKRWKKAVENSLLHSRPTTKAEKTSHGAPYAKFMMEVFNRRIQV